MFDIRPPIPQPLGRLTSVPRTLEVSSLGVRQIYPRGVSAAERDLRFEALRSTTPKRLASTPGMPTVNASYPGALARYSGSTQLSVCRGRTLMGHRKIDLKRIMGVALLSGVITTWAGTASGQLTGIINSDVEGFFGSQSDVYQQSEGPINPTWPASPFPPLYALSGPPNVPPLYGGFPNPSFPLTQNIGFAAPAGHSPGTPFTDGTTDAGYHIVGGTGGPLTFTQDAGVLFPGTNGLWLTQPTSAIGYAYEQVEFAMAFSVGLAGLAAGNAGPRPFLVSGTVVPGGVAQFGAEVNYWWQPTIVNTITGVLQANGPATSLGQLQYSYSTSATSFATLVPSILASRPLAATPVGMGILEITGNAFVAGDPYSISVQSVPEPSTVVLAALGGASLLLVASRRRRALAHMLILRVVGGHQTALLRRWQRSKKLKLAYGEASSRPWVKRLPNDYWRQVAGSFSIFAAAGLRREGR